MVLSKIALKEKDYAIQRLGKIVLEQGIILITAHYSSLNNLNLSKFHFRRNSFRQGVSVLVLKINAVLPDNSSPTFALFKSTVLST